MNPFSRGKKSHCLSLFVLFLFFSGLLPVLADDYGRPVGHDSGQELEEDELNQPIQKPDKLDQQTHKPDKLDQQTHKPDKLDQQTHKPDKLDQQTHKPDKLDQQTHKPDKLDQQTHKSDKLDQQTHKPDKLGKKTHKLDKLGKKTHESDKLDQKGNKSDKLDQQKSPAEKLGPGDIALQIANATDFDLVVRASVVDASERVNLARAKSVRLAAHDQESVVLSSMSAGKVSLAPISEKAGISKDSKILLTINKGKENRRLVVSYAKSAGMIVIGKDLFPSDRESSHRPEQQPKSEEDSEKLQQKSDSSIKPQIVYVINQTGLPVSYNALLKPASFAPEQGELKPGANVLKFSAKKGSRALSKEQLSLVLQIKYNVPGSPMVTVKKEAFEPDSQPTVTITQAVMGEQPGQAPVRKKLK